MSTRDRLTLAAALAVALACSSLAPLYDGTGWIARTVGVVVLVALTGSLSRRAGLPALVVPLLQLVAVGLYVGVLFAASTFRTVLPTGRTLAALRALLVQAGTDIEALAPPVPSSPSLVLVAVLGAAAVAVVVDLLAVGLQRPALAGLPLLVLLAVPSGLLPGGLGWLPFTLGAAGWLGLLLVEGSDKVGRWGVPLRSAPRSTAGYDPDAGSTGRVGRRIGAAALGLAAFVPALVPGLDARLLPGTGGDGDGDATGPRTTVTYNPITELQGDLTLPEPQTVLRYSTDDPTPDYLRLTTLDVFDGSQWRSSPLRPDTDVEDGLPRPTGVSVDAGTVSVRTRFSIEALDAQWLPLPPVPSEVDVPGPWIYDEDSETVFATRSSTRRARDYTARSTRVLPRQADLRAASDIPSSLRAYAEPPNVADSVRALTLEETAGAATAYDKAVALQEFFRDTEGEGFTYSEQTRNPFDNPDALEAFLDNREGFCEQYASAMAAMLRVLGIPARVGVGFTPGTAESNGTYVVSTDDAHAWPEAWFEGEGWVRFEPTPVDDDREIVPDYTQEEETDAGGLPSTGPTASADPSASAAPDATKDLDQQLERGGESPLADPSAGTGSSLPSGRTVLTVLLVALAVAPGLLGLLRRRLRGRRPGALPAWDQLQDDAADTGFRWRPTESPRAAAARLAATRVLPEDAREALARLAAGAERARYARPGAAEDGSWRADVKTVRAALLRGAGRGARLRAVLAPPSTLQWLGSRSGGLLANVLDRFDDAVGAVGRRLRVRRA